VAADLVAKLRNLAGRIFHWALIYNLTRNTTGEYTITSYRKTVLIYNPRAGRFGRDGGAQIERIVEALTKNGHQVTVTPTTGPATAGAIARQHIAEGAGLIVVAGGDGTINEAAEGMVHTEVPLAILPGGTANVLATEMKLGKRMGLAAARIEECRPCRISVGHLTCGPDVSRHFLLMAGIGLDAHIVRNVSPGLKARTGKFAYWVAGWSLLGRKLPQVKVEIDGRDYGQCSFALASKVRNYGGDYEIAREVTLFDDRVEVVLFEGRSSAPYVKYFAALALNRLKGMKGVTVLRGQHLKLRPAGEGEPAWVQIDGELGGYLPAEIRIVPDALTLLVPPGYGE
jgi:diacylglycerol kinase family enzyme